MFKVGDRVLVKINWIKFKSIFNVEWAKTIDGMIGEVVGALKQYKVTTDTGMSTYVKGYKVGLMDGTFIAIQSIHLIKIDDDDTKPDTKSEWKDNDIWNPKNNYKKELTS